jgi:glycosyltransferase involved in cell wall biosynthesis
LTLGHSYVVGLNRRLAHEMSHLGSAWEVVAAAPTYFYGPADLHPNLLEVCKNEPCPIVPLRAYFSKRIHFFFYGSALQSLLGQGWDLVHCWEEPYILSGAQVAFWTPISTRLVFRTAQNADKKFIPPFNWIENYSMSRASGWVASGFSVLSNRIMRPLYQARAHRLIPLGVDVNAFRPDPRRGAEVRRSLWWDADGPPVVGFLGRLVPEKGVQMLTRVLDRLATPWRALFVGTGPLESWLRRWARRHGDRIRICKDVCHESVPGYLNAMDVLCAPSQTFPNWREQFGRMLIEAFACGVPVVGSDSGEIPNVLEDTGVVVGEKDEEGWCSALGRLLDSEGSRRELAARGLERARTTYSWTVVARQHIEFFEEVLDSRGRRLPPTNKFAECILSS